ncbi:MAG: GNAT family N-acetyltransferase [Woeseiaceae bacterium]|nr:GNAT family N-acetyltransferase [Woeseiaceae bacterium]
MIIRAAVSEEARLLSELALRSKAHWGYSDAFIEACRNELTVQPEQIQNCVCADDDGVVIGFYGLAELADDGVELEALFVEPSSIGSGVGKALIEHAISRAASLGASRMLIQGDPNAEAFYLAAGASRVGERASGSIPGRSLPLFEIPIKA